MLIDLIASLLAHAAGVQDGPDVRVRFAAQSGRGPHAPRRFMLATPGGETRLLEADEVYVAGTGGKVALETIEYVLPATLVLNAGPCGDTPTDDRIVGTADYLRSVTAGGAALFEVEEVA